MSRRTALPILLLALLAATSAFAAVGDLGPQQRISATGADTDADFDALTSDLAYNPTANQYLVVWRGETTTEGEIEIFGRFLAPGGAPAGPQFRISTMGPDGNATFDAFAPTVTYNETANEYLVAWDGDDNAAPLVDGESEIFAQRLSATGTELGTDDQRISAMGPDGNVNFDAFLPTATYNATANEYLIAWEADDNTGSLIDEENEIYAQRLSATGGELGVDDQRISAMGPDGSALFDGFDPNATYNSIANEYLIAWEADDNTGSLIDEEAEVYTQRLSATGAEIGADDQRVSAMGPDGNAVFAGFDATATYNSTANEYLIAWGGDDNTAPLADNEFEVFTQRLSATGAELGTDDQRISAMGPDGSPTFAAGVPTATYNSTANEYLVVFEGDDDAAPSVNDDFEIYAQRLSADGAELGNDDQRVSMMGPDGSTTFGAFDSTAAYNPAANEYVIAWSGDDTAGTLVDEKFEIYDRSLEGPAPADTTLDGAGLDLAGKLKLKGKELKIKLGVGCAEPCTVTASATATGKPAKKGKRVAVAERRARSYTLKPASAELAAAGETTLTLKLKGGKKKRQKATRNLAKGIARGDKVKVNVSVEFSDAAGNSTSLADAAKLKR